MQDLPVTGSLWLNCYLRTDKKFSNVLTIRKRKQVAEVAINNFVKRLQDIMRNDAGVNGDAQRIEQIVWTLFLKIYDAKEEEWELIHDNYVSILPETYKWRN